MGSFILPPLADVYGRKPMFIIGLSLNLIALFGLFYSKKIEFLIFWLILGSFFETGKFYVAYVYAIDCFQIRDKKMQGLSFLVFLILLK